MNLLSNITSGKEISNLCFISTFIIPLFKFQDCTLATEQGDVYSLAMNKTRVEAQKECEIDRGTLRDQLDQTFVADYIQVFKGFRNS